MKIKITQLYDTKLLSIRPPKTITVSKVGIQGPPGLTGSLKTTERIIIKDSMAILPSEAIGDIVWNTAIIFNSIDSNVIEAEVSVTTDSINVIFSNEDVEDNMYCIVTYLTKKEEYI